MPLTDAKIRNAKAKEKSYKIADGKGLYLEVTTTGSKLWRYRYRIEGKENIYSIGAYDEWSLSQAREELIEARKLVKQGVHPSHHRKAKLQNEITENRNTFEAVARDWIDQNKGNWRHTI